MKKYQEYITRQDNLHLFYDTLSKDAEAIARIRTWIDALRSGKYKQGKEQLMQIGPLKYCCLGVANVACELGERDWQCLDNTYKQLHLRNGEGLFLADGSNFTLTNCNDSHGWTFSDIATFLENQLNAVLAQPAQVAQ